MANETLASYRAENGTQVSLVRGDITQERVDAIVNAANSHLQHGGGVAAAISRAGGPAIQSESNAVGYVPVGGAAVTGGGLLPARYVIHAVGPIWGSGNEERLLADAVRSSLKAAEERELASISMPAISSGIYGFPKDACAEVLLDTIEAYLEEHPVTSLREIRLCVYDAPTVEAFEEVWAVRYPY